MREGRQRRGCGCGKVGDLAEVKRVPKLRDVCKVAGGWKVGESGDIVGRNVVCCGLPKQGAAEWIGEGVDANKCVGEVCETSHRAGAAMPKGSLSTQ